MLYEVTIGEIFQCDRNIGWYITCHYINDRTWDENFFVTIVPKFKEVNCNLLFLLSLAHLPV